MYVLINESISQHTILVAYNDRIYLEVVQGHKTLLENVWEMRKV